MIYRLFFFSFIFSVPFFVGAQSFSSLDSINCPIDFENIYVKKIQSDKNQSAFIIWINKEVKLHKHLTHSESIYILEGEGNMKIGDKTMRVIKGDYYFIPENTTHGVKVSSLKPMKVLSIQAPEFDGKDRVLLED